MKVDIVNFKTQDLLKLPGFLFEPDKFNDKKRAAIFIHGNGTADIFDHYEDINAIAEEFTKKDIAYFVFNNRGARYIQKFKVKDAKNNKKTIWGGKAYELIKDCLLDIDGAVSYLKKLGYEELYLIGGSTGANKILIYNYYKPDNGVSKYILGGGGDDTGIYYESLSESKYRELLEISENKVKSGNGLEVAKETIYGYLYSYQSLYDVLNPDGDYNVFPFYEAQNGQLGTKELFREIKSVSKPTLLVYGESDEYCKPTASNCLSVLRNAVDNRSNFRFELISGSDHSFSGFEKEISELEIDFLLS